MNQVFTKKKLAAALTLAFATGGAAVLAVAPVPGLVAAAQANQFADTTIAVGTSAGVDIAATSSASVTGQVVTITENVAGAIGPANATFMQGGTIVIQTDAGKIKSATVKLEGAAFSLDHATKGNLAAASTTTLVGGDTNGKLVFAVNAISTAAAKITLSEIVMDTTGVSTGTPVNLTIATSSTATGLTKGTTHKIATVAANAVTLGTAPTAAQVVAGTASGNLPSFTFSENLPGTVGTATADVTLTLKNGYAWSTTPVLSTSSGTVGSAGAATLATNNTVAQYTLTAASTAAATFTFSNAGTVFVPAGSTQPVVATLTVKKSGATLLTTDVTLGSVVEKGITATFVESTGASTASYGTLYSGRIYAASAIADRIKIKETTGGALATGSTLSFALSNGATFTSDSAGTVLADNATITAFSEATDGFDLGTTDNDNIVAVASSDKSKATFTVWAGAADASAGETELNIAKLSTVGATEGDLNVTVSTNAMTSALTAIKMAAIKHATTNSVSGTIATALPGAASSTALPDIVITESAKGALVVGTLSILAPTNVTFDTTTAPTVTVTDSTGTLTGIVTTPATTHFVANAAGTAASVYNVALTTASTNNPYTITIKGLKVKASSAATSGDLNVKVIGNANAVGAAPAAAVDETTNAGNVGAKPTSTSLKVATIGSNTVPTIPAATVTGAVTSQTITGSAVAAGNDQGKLGTLYIAAVLPSTAGGGVYLKNSSGAWVAYNPASPAYYASPVTLGTHTLDVVSALDLSSIVGTKIYAGYGLGTTDFGVATPWNNMLSAGSYNLIYTVAQ